MKEWLKTEETLQESGIFDPQCITPLDRSRLRKKMAKKYQDTENSPQVSWQLGGEASRHEKL